MASRSDPAPSPRPGEEGSRERYDDPQTWLTIYRRWIESWRYLIAEHGLNAAVYTQISDVEHETNGWLTYDREVSKIFVETLRGLHSEPYKPAPRPRRLMEEHAGMAERSRRSAARMGTIRLQ